MLYNVYAFSRTVQSDYSARFMQQDYSDIVMGAVVNHTVVIEGSYQITSTVPLN